MRCRMICMLIALAVLLSACQPAEESSQSAPRDEESYSSQPETSGESESESAAEGSVAQDNLRFRRLEWCFAIDSDSNLYEITFTRDEPDPLTFTLRASDIKQVTYIAYSPAIRTVPNVQTNDGKFYYIPTTGSLEDEVFFETAFEKSYSLQPGGLLLDEDSNLYNYDWLAGKVPTDDDLVYTAWRAREAVSFLPDNILILYEDGSLSYWNGSKMTKWLDNIKQIHSSSYNMLRMNIVMAVGEDNTLYHNEYNAYYDSPGSWEPLTIPNIQRVYSHNLMQLTSGEGTVPGTDNIKFTFPVAVSEMSEISFVSDGPMPKSVYLGLGADGQIYWLSESEVWATGN